jgi:Flp pilus assembly CpaF family ATPase
MVFQKIETYTIQADIPLVVDIGKDDAQFVKQYILHLPEFGAGTRAMLNDLKSKIVTEINISSEKMLDAKFVSELKRTFKEKADTLLRASLPQLPRESQDKLAAVILNEMVGLGPIEFLLADGNLEEIVVNSSNEPVWVYHKKYGWLKTNIVIYPEAEIQNYASIIARRVGKQVTILNPLLDAHLVTGDRANASLFPISSRGNTITIRRFRRDPWTVTDFITTGTASAPSMAVLWLAMEYELNIMVSGGTGSGKTTLLNVMLPFIQPNQRVLTIEDSVSGKMEMVYQRDNHAVKTTVGELIDGLIEDDSILDASIENDEGIQIPSMTKNGKIEWREPSHFIRHWVKKDLLKITLKSGRTTEVTADHSLFGQDASGRIIPISGKKIVAGQNLAISPKISLLPSSANQSSQSQQLVFLREIGVVEWDQVVSIERQPFEGFVYDFSVPQNESFICNNVVCHNTRELTLPDYLHWVPMTTREPNAEGKGSVGMLDLLVNALRMRPDRIIVGEVRRQREAEVMFEAMHTGHSVYATVHANTADETITRLTSPPIEIAPSLLEAVHLNVVMFRNRRLGVRRVLQLAEFVPQKAGSEGKMQIKPNILYRWRAASDSIEKYSESIRLFDELGLHTGFTAQELTQNLSQKEKVLNWMIKQKIRDINEVGQVMAEYYSTPETVLKKAGVR